MDRSEPGIPYRRDAVCPLRDQRLEGTAPAGTQGRDAQCAFELIAWVTGHVQQRIDREHGHAFGTFSDLHDLIAGADFTFLQYAKIQARPAVRDQQRSHPRLVHADAHAVAGNARLGHFEQGAADAVAVADAHLPVGQTIDGEILPKLSMREVAPTELTLLQ